jgi:Uma2 family endonuclease
VIVHLEKEKIGGDFTPEVDFIVGRNRVARVDLLFMTPEDQHKQAEANRLRPHPHRKLRFGHIVVPPTLVVEAISEGHELHDRETKRAWYAEAGVRNYWILDGFRRTLDCLILEGSDYRVDRSGRDAEELRPSLFPGLVIRLGELWATKPD